MPVSANGYIFKSKAAPKGRDRKGYQASDLLKAMTDPEEGQRQQPRVEKPRVLIETMRVVGPDLMTAKDKALYEKLLAYARLEGMDKDYHRIPVQDVAAFVDVKKLDRLADSLERISRTFVRYDIRDEETGERIRSSMPLILFLVREKLSSGVAVIEYSIPAQVRRAILASRDYAWLEINAFASFASRYTSPIYQKLALMAGEDGRLRKPWKVSPEDLAREIGYPMEKYSYGVFKRDVLDRALVDVAMHVKRFKAHLKATTSGGRGAKVTMLTWTVSDAVKRIEEHKASDLSAAGLNVVRMADHRLGHDELPSQLEVARAVTATGLDEITLSNGWRAAYDKAKASPDEEVLPALKGSLLVDVVAKSGVGAAFRMWAGFAGDMEAVPTVRLEQPPEAKPAAPLPAPAPAPAESREARAMRHAVNAAKDFLDISDGYVPGTMRTLSVSFTDTTSLAYCDGQVEPWLHLESLTSFYGTLAAALRVLKTVVPEQRNPSLRNLASAVVAQDLDRLRKVSGAILGAAKDGTLVRVSEKPQDSSVRIGNEVDESCVEFDFGDPAYAYSGKRWDDRDVTDFEEEDEAA
jgi:hypothetical protein